jgi:Ca2+-binding RTX toxin-like protein
MRRVLTLATLGGALLAPAAAAAQPPTCSFDTGSAELAVQIYDAPATLAATPEGIKLDGVVCAGASLTSTDSIDIRGTDTANQVTLVGDFVPGRTAELDGNSEIEIGVILGGPVGDSAIVPLTDGPDTLLLSEFGIDVGGDGDEDVTLGTGGILLDIQGKGGDDVIDASAYHQYDVSVHGGAGHDIITGSDAVAVHNDYLYGDGGRDEIHAGYGGSEMWGGLGNDLLYGAPLYADTFYAEATADGDDKIFGGPRDTVSYRQRTAGVTVVVGGSDNGETGVEHDFIAAGVKQIEGGDGDDVLVGDSSESPFSAYPHRIFGWGGNDEIHGGAGADRLYGGPGNDELFGEAGKDDLFGQAGNDVIDGGAGTDAIFGGGGDDLLFNDDGKPETVDCGPGIDDPEPSSNDTFVDCEQI